MGSTAPLTDTTGNDRSFYRFGGVALNSCSALPPGNGQLPAYEYYPWDDPEFERDPHPWYTRAQAEVPVMLDDTGAYVVSRYDDVMEFGLMPCMSVEPGWDAAGPWSIASSTIIGRDAPDHTRLRRQTNKWFAPKAVREWVSTTKEVTSQILDATEGGRLDGWRDLSVLPTHRTMCRVLQVDDNDAMEVMAEMADTMPMLSARPRPGTWEKAAEGFDKLAQRIDAMLDGRSASSADGLTDALLDAEREGTISSEEMRATALLLYSLGHMDVGYLIAAGLRVFAELPEVYAAFRKNEEFRDAIINEIVRMDPPELSFYRTTLEDVIIRGVNIPAGSRIRFMISAANRDPEFFDQPHHFDYHRPQTHSKNLSFGLGPHTCAGQGYARAQARTIFEEVAARFKSIELEVPFEMDNTDFSRHYTTLPLRLSN
ncbi:cytochrome P450 [Paenarthrobacter aromaticivorans]|uniref:Cytochrome P450 n=1 Tax=Paenarthrobacter aromaticivorans TaxID=2849150 RepID=A0ABS6IBN8_9MICC|nr:cytochrome P450 [Paenarthrobacter sp. MMS21-TAE1-1]MBU8867799.1 cytochrome P450 [Paenarthrobacter sp. MMS21-TAE1-1]